MNKPESECSDIISDIETKSSSKECSDMKIVSGIYKITNKLDGKAYPGSSADILSPCGRFYHHRRMLRKGIHHCVHLQRAYDRDGLENFSFDVVELVAPISSLLLEIEQKYLNIARANPEMYYNTVYDAGRITMTPEIRSKIGAKSKARLANKENHPMYGKKHRPDTIEKIREARKLQAPITEDGRNRLVEFNTGKKWPENSKRFSGTGNPRTDHTVYLFENPVTNQSYRGKRFDFIKEFNLPRWISYELSTGRSSKGWRATKL